MFVEVPCRDWEHKPVDEPHLLFFDEQAMRELLVRLGLSQISLSYHGRAIADLRRRMGATRIGRAVAARMLSAGFVGPMGRMGPGLECVDDRMGRAAARLFDVHRERTEPAWWLRALAIRTD